MAVTWGQKKSPYAGRFRGSNFALPPLQIRCKSVPCIGGIRDLGFDHTKTEIGQGAVDHQQFIAKVVGEVGSAEIVKGIADEG